MNNLQNFLVALMIEAVRTSETSGLLIRDYTAPFPEGYRLHNRRNKNMKSQYIYKIKRKPVTLHAMMALVGRGDIAPNHS
jgi:hypothetical protein